MQRCGLAALVAGSPTHVTYLSDYQYWGDAAVRGYMSRPGGSSGPGIENYAVFTAAGAGTLVVPPLHSPEAEASWMADVRVFGKSRLDDSLTPPALSGQAREWYDRLHGPRPPTAVEALAGALRDHGLAEARIGLELEGIRPEAQAALRSALPQATWLDCTNLLRYLRAVKSAVEIRRITQSTLIAEAAAQAAFGLAAPGRPLAALVTAYRAELGKRDADFDHLIFGVHGMGVGQATRYVPQAGDAILVDYGCRYQHYVSDTGLTLMYGPTPPALAERYANLYAALQAGAAALRPGMRASEVRAAMRSRLEADGLDTCFAHGHGFGLEVRDYPIIVEDTGLPLRDDCLDVPADLPLEADMILNLETPLYLAGAATLHIEQTYLVTAAGAQPLVPLERAQPLSIPLT